MAAPPTIGLADDLNEHRTDRVLISHRVIFAIAIGKRVRCGPLVVPQETSLSKHRLVPESKKIPLGDLLREILRDGEEPPPRRIQAGDLSVREELALYCSPQCARAQANRHYRQRRRKEQGMTAQVSKSKDRDPKGKGRQR